MVKWEHMAIMVGCASQFQKRTACLGSEGWELVSVSPDETGAFAAFFKRPVASSVASGCTCRSLHGDDPCCPKHAQHRR